MVQIIPRVIFKFPSTISARVRRKEGGRREEGRKGKKGRKGVREGKGSKEGGREGREKSCNIQ